MIKLALAYRLNGMPETGLLVYQDLQARVENDFQRAQLLLLLGQTYMEMGEAEAAFASYLETVENYPLAYDSYTSLVELVNNGQAVSDLDRGLVDYFAGQYALAQAAFDRYLVAPEDETGGSTALYYRGLTKRALGDISGAIEDWDVLISVYPFTIQWDSAWEQKGYTQWAWQDQYPDAVQTFLDFVEGFPDHPARWNSWTLPPAYPNEMANWRPRLHCGTRLTSITPSATRSTGPLSWPA